MKTIPLILILSVLSGWSCKQANKEKVPFEAQKENWEPLFNGRNLDGWVAKISGYPAGENFGNTFRVEDGILQNNYDAYGDDFQSRFGHLFTEKEYSSYKLRAEYRFKGEAIKGAPEWAYLNNGIMIHAQSPETMQIDQWFPASVEVQLLASDNQEIRTTGNVCTPGTAVRIDNEIYPDHCAASSSRTFPPDEWVTIEIVVYGDSLVHHIVQGDTVLTYTHLTLDGEGLNTETPFIPGILNSGRIAIQSEGHPTEFRKIEILDLSEK
ncbi:MAG: DUF1080 domain-containing protein [Candidatus Symbiothrix sp.]|jgi:hypothetical protein|nr:DUF1080 domain-containing protein [Candidatus Symbiothrix sp.]